MAAAARARVVNCLRVMCSGSPRVVKSQTALRASALLAGASRSAGAGAGQLRGPALASWLGRSWPITSGRRRAASVAGPAGRFPMSAHEFQRMHQIGTDIARGAGRIGQPPTRPARHRAAGAGVDGRQHVRQAMPGIVESAA